MSFRDDVRNLHALTARKAAHKRSLGFWTETRELNYLVKSKLKEGCGRDSLLRAIQEQVDRPDAAGMEQPRVGRGKPKRMFALGFLLGFGWQSSRGK
jgi:hypothetical protein